MGNPTLWPLIYNTGTEDILLVQINPLSREDTPKKAQEIANRLNEITFNSSLIAEMRAINFVSKLIKENKLDAKQYKDVKMHMITACDLMMDLDASSKLNASWDFFQHLKNIGREVTDQWLARNKKSIGQASTVNIKEVFLKK
jgi:NTE family protein